MSYILAESVLSTAALYMVLKKIMTPFEQWDAYKLGIIDKEGNKLKSPYTSKEREAWDLLSKFTCNFKKIIIKFLGKANFITYFTMAYLLKDSVDYFYIDHNKKVLHEKYLYDFTMSKQNELFKIIKEVENEFGNEVVSEQNIEMLMLKYLPIFETKIDKINLLL